MSKPIKDAVYELNQYKTVCRLMLVSLGISMGEGLKERSQIRILSFPKMSNFEVKHGAFCHLQDSYPILWWFSFDE